MFSSSSKIHLLGVLQIWHYRCHKVLLLLTISIKIFTFSKLYQKETENSFKLWVVNYNTIQIFKLFSVSFLTTVVQNKFIELSFLELLLNSQSQSILALLQPIR